jgi:hypothetical protein
MNAKTAQQQVKQQQYYISITCNTYANVLHQNFQAVQTTKIANHLFLRDVYPTIGLLVDALQQLLKML